MQKFKNKKTSFAEFGEPVSELPTFLAFIEYVDQNTTFEYGKDFNWIFQSDMRNYIVTTHLLLRLMLLTQ